MQSYVHRTFVWAILKILPFQIQQAQNHKNPTGINDSPAGSNIILNEELVYPGSFCRLQVHCMLTLYYVTYRSDSCESNGLKIMKIRPELIVVQPDPKLYT